MDVERVNAVLQKAIVGLQEVEIEGMIEATAGSGARAYEVPSPASMGMKPKAPKLKGWSTKKLDFTIRAKNSWEEDTKEALKAAVKGAWAVHKSTIGARRGWVITHQPSGQVVMFSGMKGTFHSKKKDAQQVVERWIEAVPELLKASTPGVIKKNVRVMQDIADEGAIGSRQRPQKPKVVEPVTIAQSATLDLLKINILKAMKWGKWMMTNHVERKTLRDKRLKGTSATEFMKALYALKKEGKVEGASMKGDPVWRLV